MQKSTGRKVKVRLALEISHYHHEIEPFQETPARQHLLFLLLSVQACNQ